jgi:hypothetical protein
MSELLQIEKARRLDITEDIFITRSFEKNSNTYCFAALGAKSLRMRYK